MAHRRDAANSWTILLAGVPTARPSRRPPGAARRAFRRALFWIASAGLLLLTIGIAEASPRKSHGNAVSRSAIAKPIKPQAQGPRWRSSDGGARNERRRSAPGASRPDRPALLLARADGSRPMPRGSDIVAEARRHLGTNPTGWSRNWCARFMNLVLHRTGHKTSRSNLARDFARYGRRIKGPRVGAIAVVGRGRPSHVGVISAIRSDGAPIVISGNYSRTVAEAAFPRSSIVAYVIPN